MKLKIVTSLLILILLFGSIGCLQESKEKTTIYEIRLKQTYKGKGSINNTEENFNELKNRLAHNESLRINEEGQNRINLDILNWTSGYGLNLTEAKMTGRIIIGKNEVKIQPYTEFKEEDISEKVVTKDLVENKTRKVLKKNSNGYIEVVKDIYDLHLVSHATTVSSIIDA